MQLRQDIQDGILPCNERQALELAAFALQGGCLLTTYMKGIFLYFLCLLKQLLMLKVAFLIPSYIFVFHT